jgi:hypothetical protein
MTKDEIKALASQLCPNIYMTQDKAKIIETPPHLGGHQMVCHTDFGALDWAIKKFNVKTFLEVGCGLGTMISYATQKGLAARGIDGDPILPAIWEEAGMRDVGEPLNCVCHDFTMGPCPLIEGIHSDLSFSVEFLEHVEEKYMPNYMHAFQTSRYAICTAAPPGHTGHHHVNCKSKEYWIDAFSRYGFVYCEDFSQELREASTMLDDQPHTIFAGSNDFIKGFDDCHGMVFENIFPNWVPNENHMDVNAWHQNVEKYYELWWV